MSLLPYSTSQSSHKPTQVQEEGTQILPLDGRSVKEVEVMS